VVDFLFFFHPLIGWEIHGRFGFFPLAYRGGSILFFFRFPLFFTAPKEIRRFFFFFFLLLDHREKAPPTSFSLFLGVSSFFFPPRAKENPLFFFSRSCLSPSFQRRQGRSLSSFFLSFCSHRIVEGAPSLQLLPIFSCLKEYRSSPFFFFFHLLREDGGLPFWNCLFFLFSFSQINRPLLFLLRVSQRRSFSFFPFSA